MGFNYPYLDKNRLAQLNQSCPTGNCPQQIVKSTPTGLFDSFTSLLGGAVDTVTSTVGSVVDTVYSAGSTVIDPVVSGVSTVNDILATYSPLGIVTNVVTDAATTVNTAIGDPLNLYDLFADESVPDNSEYITFTNDLSDYVTTLDYTTLSAGGSYATYVVTNEEYDDYYGELDDGEYTAARVTPTGEAVLYIATDESTLSFMGNIYVGSPFNYSYWPSSFNTSQKYTFYIRIDGMEDSPSAFVDGKFYVDGEPVADSVVGEASGGVYLMNATYIFAKSGSHVVKFKLNDMVIQRTCNVVGAYDAAQDFENTLVTDGAQVGTQEDLNYNVDAFDEVTQLIYSLRDDTSADAYDAASMAYDWAVAVDQEDADAQAVIATQVVTDVESRIETQDDLNTVLSILGLGNTTTSDDVVSGTLDPTSTNNELVVDPVSPVGGTSSAETAVEEQIDTNDAAILQLQSDLATLKSTADYSDAETVNAISTMESEINTLLDQNAALAAYLTTIQGSSGSAYVDPVVSSEESANIFGLTPLQLGLIAAGSIATIGGVYYIKSNKGSKRAYSRGKPSDLSSKSLLDF